MQCLSSYLLAYSGTVWRSSCLNRWTSRGVWQTCSCVSTHREKWQRKIVIYIYWKLSVCICPFCGRTSSHVLSLLGCLPLLVDSFKQFCNRSRDPPCVTGQLGLLDRRAKEEGWSGGQETKAGGGSSEKRARGTSHAFHGPLHSDHLSMQTTPCLFIQTTSVLRPNYTSSFRLSHQPHMCGVSLQWCSIWWTTV